MGKYNEMQHYQKLKGEQMNTKKQKSRDVKSYKCDTYSISMQD